MVSVVSVDGITAVVATVVIDVISTTLVVTMVISVAGLSLSQASLVLLNLR